MRSLNRLTARTVESLAAPGRYPDGGNLFLSIKNGGRSWIFLYRDRGTGRLREMGLGSVAAVRLTDARKKADAARLLLSNGVDPLDDKRTRRAASAATMSFGDYVEKEFLKSALVGFKNDKHKQQWENTLKTYAAPLWTLKLNAIVTDDVRKVLEPIWHTKKETATRVRGRVERVLSAAKAAGYRDGENPARWKDNLQPIFGTQKRAVKHMSALPYKVAPGFVGELRKRDSVSAKALEFTVLTVLRTSEVILARRKEFDLKEKLWIVPPERMKMKKEHRVPLCDRAIEILKSFGDGKPDDFIFTSGAHGAKRGDPLSDMAMLECLRDLHEGITVHGFRSTFRDWAGDETSFPRDLIEMALAHKIESEVEASYRRSDALKKRRELMAAWARYLDNERGNVVKLKRPAAE